MYELLLSNLIHFNKFSIELNVLQSVHTFLQYTPVVPSRAGQLLQLMNWICGFCADVAVIQFVTNIEWSF